MLHCVTCKHACTFIDTHNQIDLILFGNGNCLGMSDCRVAVANKGWSFRGLEQLAYSE